MKELDIIRMLKSEMGSSERDLLDQLVQLERARALIGLSHQEGIAALDNFLLDCKWITQDEREDIMERTILVKGGDDESD